MSKQAKNIIEDSIGAACIVIMPLTFLFIAFGAGY